MRPVQYPAPNYQPVPGILPPVTIRDFRGVNTFDPLSIAENYFTDMSNLTSDDYPAASVRPGYSVLGSVIGTKVLGLGVWKDTELHAVFNDGTWRKWTGSAWSSALASGLSTTAEWSFTNFQGNLSGINLIASNGVDPIKRYDGASVSNLSGAPAGGNFITTYQNRLWCAVGKEVHACKLDDPTSWTSFAGTEEDSYVKDMESSRGENVNMLSGSLTKLTIGMPNSLHELYGGVPSDFNTHLITEDEGVSNNKSVATTEGIMRFAHKVGLFEYAGGTIPDKAFSDIVEGYLADITASSVVGSDGRKHYFLTSSDKMLVFDPRPGVRAWNVWRNIFATQFVIFQKELYIGDNSGRVLKLGGAVTDGGTPISWYAITKPFTSPSMAQPQRWYKMWAPMELAAGSTVDIYISRLVSGDSDWELVQSITNNGLSFQRVNIPVGQYAYENVIRVKFEGTGWARLHELTRQMRQMPLV